MPGEASYRPGELIVMFADSVPDDARRRVIADMGHTVINELRHLRVFLVAVPVGDEHRSITAYQRRPEVEFAELNHMSRLA